MWVVGIILCIVLGALGYYLFEYIGMIIGGIFGLSFAAPGKTYFSWSHSSHTSSEDGEQGKSTFWGWGSSDKDRTERGERGESSSWGSSDSGSSSSWGSSSDSGGGSSSSD